MAEIPVNSVSATDKTGKFAFHQFNRRAVGENDVHIKISYSGICHSDIHTVLGEWGPQEYPCCVGHEILGTVVAVGDKVDKFKVGDPAGVGCMVGSCRSCEECKNGDEQHCQKGMVGTYTSKQDKSFEPSGVTKGGYSSGIVVAQDFVIKIPKNMDGVAAVAPLLCAGITCYDPFVKHGLKSGMNLGVIGLGGLGHMAVKIGAAMGCHVTVLSRGTGKKETALKMGAENFIDSTNPEEMKAAAKTLDFMYDCIAFKHDVPSYINLLKNRGKLIMVGGIPEPIGVTSFQILARGISVIGSLIGGIEETQNMIDFCGKHNIVSEIELIPATPEAVEAAYVRAIKGDVRYRFVIDTGATLPPPSAL